jgi:hypothetical protein
MHALTTNAHSIKSAVLRIRDPGSDAFLTPGSGIPRWVKNQDHDLIRNPA